MKTFKQLFSMINEEIKHQSGSETTQVATTTGTYAKTAKKLKEHLPESGGNVLDYGAGMGKGSAAMQHELGEKHEVHSYEPFAKNWKPTFSKSSDIKGRYHAVVSHNVLNVLEPHLRDEVTSHMLSKVEKGGHVVVGARGWHGDVALNKHHTPAEHEEKAMWVHKKVKGGGTANVYQKGFDGDELLHHMQKHGGDKFEFKKISGLAKTTVIGKRIKD